MQGLELSHATPVEDSVIGLLVVQMLGRRAYLGLKGLVSFDGGEGRASKLPDLLRRLLLHLLLHPAVYSGELNVA